MQKKHGNKKERYSIVHLWILKKHLITNLEMFWGHLVWRTG